MGLEGLENLIGSLFAFVLIFFVVSIVIYVACAKFLNNFNKLVYGKGTHFCWIPYANVYLLGKLAINKFVGWILLIWMFVCSEFTVTVGNMTKTTTILPYNIRNTALGIFWIAIPVLFIYAIIKYFRLKKEKQNENY